MKRKCSRCNRTKTQRNFSYRKTVCNKCYKESDAYANQRDTYLRRTYGLTLAEYEQLLKAQGGGCAICGGLSGGKNLAVDHDHETGHVRGILCKRHNSAIARWVRNSQEARAIVDHFDNGAWKVKDRLGRWVVVPEERN